MTEAEETEKPKPWERRGSPYWRKMAEHGKAEPVTRNMRARAEEDLRWFFGDAAGELGLRAQRYDPDGRGYSDGSAAASRQTAAYARWQDTRRGLQRHCTPDDRRVLSMAFTERSWPMAIRGWHEKAGVAVWIHARTEQAIHGDPVSPDDALISLVQLIAAKDPKPAQLAELALLRARADRRLREALGRFCEGSHRQRLTLVAGGAP